MEVSNVTFLLIALIGFCATFIGTLAGSGGLIGMPLLLFIGIPVHTAIGTAKFSNIISSFSSFYYLFKRKQVSIRTALKIVPFAAIGGLVGAMIANYISQEKLTMIAIILLASAFILNIVKKVPKERTASDETINANIFPALFSISLYDGMFGPGSTTLLIYTYLYNGFHYLKSLAISRFQTFISCLSAFIIFASYGAFDWKIGAAHAFGSVIGAQLSVRFANRLSLRHVKWLLNGITVLLILQLAYEAVMI